MTIRRELPDDLMIQIMVCLPVKSIVRFRCVSKTWCDMLKSSSFINSHLLSQKRKHVLLVRRCLLTPPRNDEVLSFHDPNSPELEEVCPNLSIPFLKDIRWRDAPPPYNPKAVRILGASNGLVCIFYFEFAILCNPSLREFKQLPPCPQSYESYDSFVRGIGFGNTSTDDFKVVMIDMNDYREPQFMVNFYSSSTNSWKQIDGGGENDPTQVQHMDGLPYTGLFFNGACHWSAYRQPNYEKAILSFDLSTEVSGWLDCPDIPTYNLQSFMVINECFALVCLDTMEKVPIAIWVMKEYGVRESWTKQFAIGPLTDVRLSPFMSWENEWLLLDSRDMDPIDQLVSCSFHSNEIKKYQVYGEKGTLTAEIYKESLISLEQL